MNDGWSWQKRLLLMATVLAVMLLLAAFWFARAVGALSNALFVFLCGGAVLLLTRRAVDIARRRITLDVYRRPRAHLAHLASMLLRFVAPLSFAWAVDVALLPAQFTQAEALQIRVFLWVAASLLALCALLPRERAWALSDAIFAVLLPLVAFDLARSLSEPVTTEAVQLQSPFAVDALVVHGGASQLINHHAGIAQQAAALDVLPLTPDGKFVDGDKQRLESYPCFGAVLRAPVSGRVAHVVRDRPDMPIGQMERAFPAGNTISIEGSSGRYVVLAHLQAGSIQVEVGQQVQVGQPIARCGNSGNTSWPHLHLQAQSGPVLSNEDPALLTYPVLFVQAERVRGSSVTSGPFAARRNDIIRPLSPSR
jgi:hypothetical protein